MYFIIQFLHVYKFNIRLIKSWIIKMKQILLLRCVCWYRWNALFWHKSEIDPGVIFKHWILIPKVLIKTLVRWKLTCIMEFWSWTGSKNNRNKHKPTIWHCKKKTIFFSFWMWIGVIMINYYDNPTHLSHLKQKVIF